MARSIDFPLGTAQALAGLARTALLLPRGTERAQRYGEEESGRR
ncbi:hypothetical protein ACWD5R_39495 [Streptomyces sp. NPDC002514]